MQDFRILGCLSIRFTISILKFTVVLLILNLVTALTNLLFRLNFLKIMPCWQASVKMLFFLHFIIFSILLINSTASSGLSLFLIDSSNPLLSISSLLLIRDSRNFSNVWFLLEFVFLVSSDPIN